MTQKTILITGASRGLGAAAARIAAEKGAAVVINARSKEGLEEVAADIERGGGAVLVVPGDVSSPEACLALIEKAVARFGRLDALINNAGIVEPVSPIAQTDPAAWQYNLAVNVLGPLVLIQAAIPHLREQNGRVINVSSGAAVSAVAGWAAYCAAKGALNQITRVLAKEEPAITAVAVRPGVVDTEMQAVIRKEGERGMTPQDHRRFVGYHEGGELLSPEKPARALVALALHAPQEWSGEFLSWDDEKVKEIMNFE
jgi:NAD(P)-dependent dehydrogenase (short-subunit alcohol dehydrogenase family)